MSEIPKIRITNPKQTQRTRLIGRAAWYPYYAGFCPEFVENILRSPWFRGCDSVLDPWNGAGTTTDIAAALGYRTWGIDLNPAMLIAARARLVGTQNSASLYPICREILGLSETITPLIESGSNDPLEIWIMPGSARQLRAIEFSIQNVLVNSDTSCRKWSKRDVNDLSSLAAFYYLILFRVVRMLCHRFIGSNKTWVKRPQSCAQRIRPDKETIHNLFIAEVQRLTNHLKEDINPIEFAAAQNVRIEQASSESLPLSDGEVSLVVTSPPYCTRIDYAVACLPELAVIGMGDGNGFENLREAMIGTSTVPKEVSEPDTRWGNTCCNFLEAVYSHRSSASSTYYYKSHYSYFHSMYRSMSEISRVLRINGTCVLVAQDSFYKDIHNDIPTVFEEMLSSLGREIVERVDYPTSRVMAAIHPSVRKYRKQRVSASESVIIAR